jgi:hypothetical protein
MSNSGRWGGTSSDETDDSHIFSSMFVQMMLAVLLQIYDEHIFFMDDKHILLHIRVYEACKCFVFSQLALISMISGFSHTKMKPPNTPNRHTPTDRALSTNLTSFPAGRNKIQ